MMKPTYSRHILAALALISFSTPIAVSQEDSSADPPEWQMRFENLDPTKREEFGETFLEATRLFNQKRIFESLDTILKAEKIFKDYPSLANLKGACYVEFRDFDKARVAFEKALELSPENGDIMFNLGELEFVTSNWAAAEERFTKINSLLGDEKMQMKRLVEFKLLLSKMKLGKQDEAKELADKYGFDDDSPFHYYAQAALSYQAEDDDKAAEWLAIASRVFTNQAVLAPWQDTLIEYGYIRSFYGGDLEIQGTTTP